jgi:hypothetical protein
VPVGGTAGQVLSKINATDYNTQWIDFTAGTAGTGGVYGVTTLEDSVASTSTTTAAVPNSVKTSYDLATTKAKVSVGTAAPVTPSTGDVWVDTAGTATAINAVPLAALTGTGAMIYGASAGTAATLAIGSTDDQLVVSGGAPAWAANPSITKATLTTTGDIIYASGSATPARLGIGTASQVLSVSGGVPAWTTPAAGGGLTLIATATPSAATTISFTSIPGTYKHLHLIWRDVFQSIEAASANFGVRLNNDTTSDQHVSQLSTGSIMLTGSATTFGVSNNKVLMKSGTSGTAYASQLRGSFTIYRYTEAEPKLVEWKCTTLADNDGILFAMGTFLGTAAITQIDFIRSSTQTVTGTFYLYGVS